MILPKPEGMECGGWKASEEGVVVVTRSNKGIGSRFKAGLKVIGASIAGVVMASMVCSQVHFGRVKLFKTTEEVLDTLRVGDDRHTQVQFGRKVPCNKQLKNQLKVVRSCCGFLRNLIKAIV